MSALLDSAFAMPVASPSYPRGPFRYVDREYLIIAYLSDRAALERPLEEPRHAAVAE